VDGSGSYLTGGTVPTLVGATYKKLRITGLQDDS
jgi:hypothetical protein